MQALNRFEPEKAFASPPTRCGGSGACIQDYILRSWSLVKIGTTANQKKLFFQIAFREKQDRCIGKRRPAPRPGGFDRKEP